MKTDLNEPGCLEWSERPYTNCTNNTQIASSRHTPHSGQASQELNYSLNHSTWREANYNLEPTSVWIQQVMGQQRLESTIRLRFKSSHFAQAADDHVAD